MKNLKPIVPTIVLAAILLFGCAANGAESQVVDGKASMFVKVEDGLTWDVYYHRDTKVMYAVSDGSYNYGTFTVLVNPDGSPMLWGDNAEPKGEWVSHVEPS